MVDVKMLYKKFLRWLYILYIRRENSYCAIVVYYLGV